MRELSILIFVLLGNFFIGFGQEGKWWQLGDPNPKEKERSEEKSNSTSGDVNLPGSVTIHIDSRIEKMIAFKGATLSPNAGPMIDGFRVQLFFDQNKEKVNKARAELLKQNEDAEVYIEYKAPNYNLLLGNFRTRLEAEKAQAALMELFPEALVVTSRIYFPLIVELPDDY